MYADPAYPVNLTDRNTMALRCYARRYIELTTLEQVLPVFTELAQSQMPYVILSGGSNIILPPQLNACVICPCIKGINTRAEGTQSIDIEVMAGENWHEFVTHSVANGWFGLENLALIPGWVGASPVQNIGAYGVQLEDCLREVKAFHIPTLTWRTLSRAECQFGYRDSLFKQQAGQWLIGSVTFRLSKIATIKVNYGDLAKVTNEVAHANHHLIPLPSDVLTAVTQLRQSKLPDPAVLPNCGSFFKNPIVTKPVLENLRLKFPKLVHYPTADPNFIKVAGGWLIDTAGLKGKGIAPIFTHTQQALVLTNHAPNDSKDRATQADILNTIRFIQQQVKDQFGIVLEPEPVWIEQNGHISTPT